MPIIAKATGGGGDFLPCPAGTHAAVCVDVVHLGILEVNFGGKGKKQHKIRIVWQVEEVRADNKPHQASKRYTLSLHEKAALRKDLESWRGRPFTAQELEGFDVEQVIGIAALLNVIQETKDGKTYANIASIMRIPKSMAAPTQRDYTRVCERAPELSSDDNPPLEDYQGSYMPADDDVPF